MEHQGQFIRGFLSLASGLLCGQSALLAASERLFLVDSQFTPSVTRIYEIAEESGVVTLRADLGEEYTPVLAMAAADEKIMYLAGTDTSPANLCAGLSACLLLRVELDDDSTTPEAIELVGVIMQGGSMAGSFTGLTFRPDGRLYGTSQETDSLYRIDTLTAQATLIGTAGIDLYGGDLTFGDGQLWAWTNADGAEGLYSVDPATAQVTPFEIHPFLDFSGIAGLGHGSVLYGTSPVLDRVYPLDLFSGLGPGMLMTLEGARFDHTRGDVDSPYCDNDLACADANPCSTDVCSPGGCLNQPVPGCCLDDGDCNDFDSCTRDSCEANRCIRRETPRCGKPLPEAPRPGRIAR